MGETQDKSFIVLKHELTNALILTLLNYARSFEIECNVCNVSI